MNTIFYRIFGTEDKCYESFAKIYTVSFPIFEQRDEEQQTAAFKDSRYHLLVTLENETVASFISYWDFETYVYIEHLAVNPSLRGKNIGSETLDAFAGFIGKTIILEIDPPVDNVSKKRLQFYERLGYKTNPYKHSHPAYKPQQYKPHELLVLSNPDSLDEEGYNTFFRDLRDIVMKA